MDIILIKMLEASQVSMLEMLTIIKQFYRNLKTVWATRRGIATCLSVIL